MSRIIVEIIAIFIACLVTFTKLDFDPDLSLLLTLFLMPDGIFVIEYIRATPERKKNKAERKRTGDFEERSEVQEKINITVLSECCVKAALLFVAGTTR